jgi:hypothetical protein
LGLAIIAIAVLGAVLILHAYWPGVMIDDARWQYQQAIDNAYEDWHPPLMAWLWHQMIGLEPGPGPMLLLQVLLYWSGFALISLSACKRGQPRLALALVLGGFLPAPFALAGSVTKDAFMEGVLLVATAFLLWRPLVSSAAADATLRIGAFAALVIAAALRFNAFFACVPLALAAMPDQWTQTKPRMLISGIAVACIFLMTGPAIASLLHAEDTDVKLSLIIFDLGGITEHSGVSAFPDLKVRDPVAVNRRCYDPSGWDSYSDWAKKPCPLGFDPFQDLIDDGDTDATQLWMHAIERHPFAYLEHRLTYFNLSSWFLVSDGPAFTAWSQSVPNPWRFSISENSILTAIVALTDWAATTPLGWPIFWIGVALAALVAGIRAGLPREPVAVAASAFLYGIGYLAVGVATGIRYYTWTFSGAAIAALLVGAELWRRRRLLDRRLYLSSAVIVVMPTLLAIAARVISL